MLYLLKNVLSQKRRVFTGDLKSRGEGNEASFSFEDRNGVFCTENVVSKREYDEASKLTSS